MIPAESPEFSEGWFHKMDRVILNRIRWLRASTETEEDIKQTVWANYFTQFQDGSRPKESIEAYISAIAGNLARRAAQERKRRADLQKELIERIASHTWDGIDETAQAELLEIAIGVLDFRMRTVITMFYFNYVDVKTISLSFGVSVKTVYKIVSDATKLMRERLTNID